MQCQPGQPSQDSIASAFSSKIGPTPPGHGQSEKSRAAVEAQPRASEAATTHRRSWRDRDEADVPDMPQILAHGSRESTYCLSGRLVLALVSLPGGGVWISACSSVTDANALAVKGPSEVHVGSGATEVSVQLQAIKLLSELAGWELQTRGPASGAERSRLHVLVSCLDGGGPRPFGCADRVHVLGREQASYFAYG